MAHSSRHRIPRTGTFSSTVMASAPKSLQMSGPWMPAIRAPRSRWSPDPALLSWGSWRPISPIFIMAEDIHFGTLGVSRIPGWTLDPWVRVNVWLYFQLLKRFETRFFGSPKSPKTKARHAARSEAVMKPEPPTGGEFFQQKRYEKIYTKTERPWTFLHWHIFLPQNKHTGHTTNKFNIIQTWRTDQNAMTMNMPSTHPKPPIYYLTVRCCSLNSTMSRLEHETPWNGDTCLADQNCACAVRVRDMINP